jgi:hypothetical protein
MPRRLARPLPATILLAALAAGCGSMTNTLQQDLAYERVRKCEHVNNNIRLERIDADGKVWVTMQNGTAGYGDWQACMQRAAQEQARQPKAAAMPPIALTATGGSGTIAGPLAAPTWIPGEEWAMRWQDGSGSGTYVTVFVREERVGEVECYVAKTGRDESVYRKSDLALVRQLRDGAVRSVSTPPRPQFSWPLAVGKSWEETVHQDNVDDRSSRDTTWRWTVEAQETITVTAGTFPTLKIVAINASTGQTVYEMWYAPDVKWWVRLREHRRDGIRERELIGFKTPAA